MTKRVGILSVGLSSAGGPYLTATWNSLMKGLILPRVWRCPDGVTRNVGTYNEGGSDVYALAEDAIREALTPLSRAFEVPYPEALFVGSSSDTVAYRESNHPPTLQVSARLSASYGFDTFHQVSTACASSSYAIAMAMDFIRTGRAEVVIAGGTDEVTFSSIQGFSAWRIYGDRCRPFAADRHGLILSEGAAFLVLAREGVGEPIAYLTGAGLVSDAENMADMNAEGVRRAMVWASLEADCPEIDAVFAHGTGTDSNDEAESEAIAHAWVIPPCKVVSYKGVLGHPQGASGAIAVVLAVQALRTQELFATVPPDELDSGLAIAKSVTTKSGKVELHDIMCLSHGSWGVYSALVVSL